MTHAEHSSPIGAHWYAAGAGFISGVVGGATVFPVVNDGLRGLTLVLLLLLEGAGCGLVLLSLRLSGPRAAVLRFVALGAVLMLVPFGIVVMTSRSSDADARSSATTALPTAQTTAPAPQPSFAAIASPSDTASQPQPATPPATPAGVSAVVRADSRVAVTWTAQTDSDGFRVFVDDEDHGRTLPANATSLVIEGLVGDRSFCIEVLAFNTVGQSERSAARCLSGVDLPPRLPDEGTPPDDAPRARERIVETMESLYRDGDQTALLDDATGVLAAIEVLRRVTPDLTVSIRLIDVSFTSPTEAWLAYDLITPTSTLPNRFGLATFDEASGWRLSRATFCQDLAVAGSPCTPSVSGVLPPRRRLGADAVTSTPSIANVIGSRTTFTGSARPNDVYYPLLVVEYTDRECDVASLRWEYADNVIAPYTVRATGTCSAGRGEAMFHGACSQSGVWQHWIVLIDLAGQESTRRPVTFECQIPV